jgi:Arc/MetJ-type ribon-helix-helix transcriptional regulator
MEWDNNGAEGEHTWKYQSMKVSMSLPNEDVAFLETYAQEKGLASRSAALRQAIRLLKATGMNSAYEAAWDEWSGEESSVWNSAASDRLD